MIAVKNRVRVAGGRGKTDLLKLLETACLSGQVFPMGQCP